MTSGRGRSVGQRKKLIEDGEYGGKGRKAHAAGRSTADNRGRSLQGTTRPGHQPDDSVAKIVAIMIIPFWVLVRIGRHAEWMACPVTPLRL